MSGVGWTRYTSSIEKRRWREGNPSQTITWHFQGFIHGENMMRFYPAENEIHIIQLTEFHVGLPRLGIVVDRSILSTKLWDMGGKVTPGLISNKATSLDAAWRHINVTSKVDSQLFWLFRLNPRLVKYETSATWPFVKVSQTLNLPFFLRVASLAQGWTPSNKLADVASWDPPKPTEPQPPVSTASCIGYEILPSGVLEKFFHPETSQGKFHSSPHEKLAKPPGPFF